MQITKTIRITGESGESIESAIAEVLEGRRPPSAMSVPAKW